MPFHHSNDNHFSYMKVNRHWSSVSENYAGGDSLLTALEQGWEVSDTVYFEEIWYAGSRQVMLYHVELNRDGETVVMPVLSNPYIRRLLPRVCKRILPISERSSGLRRERSEN
jgi:hypothetical protein